MSDPKGVEGVGQTASEIPEWALNQAKSLTDEWAYTLAENWTGAQFKHADEGIAKLLVDAEAEIAQENTELIAETLTLRAELQQAREALQRYADSDGGQCESK